MRCGVLLGQANDAQTGTVAHLRVGLVVEDALEQPRRVRTEAARPVHHARRRPLQMSLMTLGTVLVLGDGVTSPATAQVRSDPVALVKDLHRGWGGADFHDLLHQSVGHAVEVLVESDVVVDVDRGPRPLAHVEALGGQGRQSRFFQAVNRLARDPSRLRNGRSFSRTSNSRIAWLSSGRLKNLRLRSAAMIQRWHTCTPLSTLALSRGL